MQWDSSHESSGDSRNGSGGQSHHQQEGRSSHQNKPQSEPSHWRHVDPHTNREPRPLKLKSNQDVLLLHWLEAVQLNHAIRF
jgi:hypothetical protein